jgi:hypothetical protein
MTSGRVLRRRTPPSGFDAKPGTLEARLVVCGHELPREFASEVAYRLHCPEP